MELPFSRPLVAVIASLTAGCASSRPRDAIETSQRFDAPIRWPAEYAPEKASFFVHNEIEIAASPETVWKVLIQAETWPDWYEGASKVQIQGEEEVLQNGSVFTWKTMGLNFTSTIKEFEPYERLAWESEKKSIRGWHAWLIVPSDAGCTLVTDESQHGFMTFLEKTFQPNKLYRLHDVWLAEIKRKAEAADTLARNKTDTLTH
ncbi:MAG: SRPBCC domain-containing protein [Myxococcota bacterium]